MVLICLTTLLVTIYQTRRRGLPTWKTSIYSLVFGYQHYDQEMVMIPKMKLESNHAASGDGDGDEANEERKQVQEMSTLRPAATADLANNYSALAKAMSVRLKKLDGHWIFDRKAL